MTLLYDLARFVVSVYCIVMVGLAAGYLLSDEEDRPVPGWAVLGWPLYALFCFIDSWRDWRGKRGGR